MVMVGETGGDEVKEESVAGKVHERTKGRGRWRSETSDDEGSHGWVHRFLWIIIIDLLSQTLLHNQIIVTKGIRIVNSSDNNNNNKSVRNNSDELYHNDDPNNDSLNVADADSDGVKVGDGDGGDEAGIRSLPYKKHGPYTCPRCMAFARSQH
ncbi:hypothetical protein PIB30_035569 [Stylosanthes scabra]|uniref:Uncharacterized protein n=1 Tax=Stylosanthes scabra TaxID=79078 RepID=A0ABU6UCJ0_9FABA|nr:hypothetical protein [Stylosanthes scabra]